MDLDKPRRKSGAKCPLLRKDVSKVCHSCEWYLSIPVTKPEAPNNVVDHWGCAMSLGVIVGRSLGTSMDGAQKSIESFRNQMVRQNDSLIAQQTNSHDAYIMPRQPEGAQ